MSRTLSWDAVPETTAVTSNPAAGVISVDVKTFTSRGRVSAVACSCVADANVATRTAILYKVTAAGASLMAVGATFTASTTGVLNATRGNPGTWGSYYCALGHLDFAPGDILRVVVSNGQAGDDLSAITYSYKEML